MRPRYHWRNQKHVDAKTLKDMGLNGAAFYFASHEYARLLAAGAAEDDAIEHARTVVRPHPDLTEEQLDYVRHRYRIGRAQAQRIAGISDGRERPPRPDDAHRGGAAPSRKTPAEGDTPTVREGCDSEADRSPAGAKS